MTSKTNPNVINQLFFLFLFFALSSYAHADHGSGPHVNFGLSAPSTSEGDYSVSWTTIQYVQLQKKVGNGVYNTIYQGNDSPQHFAGRPPGIYSYRLYRNFHSPRRGQIHQYTHPVTVVVTAPQPLDLSDIGFRGDYRAHSGDLNGNGRTDLILVRVGGESSPTAPDNFALMQNHNRTFWIDDTLTPSQVLNAQAWPESAVSLVQRDINADGRLDVLIQEFTQDSNFTTPVDDQIVFAPGRSPIHLRDVDALFRQFISDTYGWMANQSYFDETAINNGWYEYQGDERTGWWSISYVNTFYSYGNGNSFLASGEDPNDPNNLPSFCQDFPWLCTFSQGDGFWLVYGTFLNNIQVIIDYSQFSQDARELAAAAGDAFHDDDASASGDADLAEDILEGVFEVSIGQQIQEVLADPMPVPELPSGDQLPLPQDGPWGDGNPANDPEYGKNSEERKKWAWRVLGKVGIVVCGLFTCGLPGDDYEDLEMEWRHFGWQWAIYDLAEEDIDPDQEQPRIVIGEGEGGPVYQRIPAAAAQYGALYFDPGLFSSEPESAENFRFMWGMNHSWLDFFTHLQSEVFDIGLYNARVGARGVFYPCERHILIGYPHRIPKWFLGTESHNFGPCQFFPNN